MKKLILFLIVSMTMVSMSYSQNTEKKQIPDSSELTMMKVYNDVKGVLVGLSSSLKVGAEHVFYVIFRMIYTGGNCLAMIKTSRSLGNRSESLGRGLPNKM